MDKHVPLSAPHNLINLLDAPFLCYNKTGRIVYANDFLCNTLGYLPNEIVGEAVDSLVLDPHDEVFVRKSSLLRAGKLSGTYLRLKPGAAIEKVGPYISYFGANLHSIKVTIQVLPNGPDLFLAFFTLYAHRLSAHILESSLSPIVTLDRRGRIVEYNINFFLQFISFVKLPSYHGIPIGDFLADKEWEKVQAWLAEKKRYLQACARDSQRPWRPVFPDGRESTEEVPWQFGPNGEWKAGPGSLTGTSSQRFSFAMLDKSVRADSDIKIEFQVRCRKTMAFSTIVCGKRNGYGNTPDESGYLIGVENAADPSGNGNGVILKKKGFNLVTAKIPPVAVDAWVSCIVEKIGGRLTLSINGEGVLEYYDLAPVCDPSIDGVGFCCGLETEFRGLKIYSRKSRLDILKLGLDDSGVRMRYYPDAVYEMQILDRTIDGTPMQVVQFRDVTQLRRIAESLERTRTAHARLMTAHQALQQQLDKAEGGLIGQSPPLRKMLSQIRTVADTDAHILITGETGTGKDLVARAIHENSRRNKEPFVKVDCASLPPSLLEAELFGHEKGAFTGAIDRKMGRLEAAGGGTIFLDEIGNLDVLLQAKLLRVLQDKKFERIGGMQTIGIQARILSATNANLQALMGKGRFREDLFYRINGITIAVPALRDRPDDIPNLVEYFLKGFCTANHRPVPKVSDPVMQALRSYPWPGNIRELKNTVEHMALMNTRSELKPVDLPPLFHDNKFRAQPLRRKSGRVPPRLLTRAQISNALHSVQGNLSEAARILKIGRGSLYRLVEKHGLRKKD
ncbi:MAG: sigma 54-interacting transcriptional regulator [Fibrobacterota bacterium]